MYTISNNTGSTRREACATWASEVTSWGIQKHSGPSRKSTILRKLSLKLKLCGKIFIINTHCSYCTGHLSKHRRYLWGNRGTFPPCTCDVGDPECHWGNGTTHPQSHLSTPTQCIRHHCCAHLIHYLLVFIVVLVSRFIIRLDITFKKAHSYVSVVTDGSGSSRVWHMFQSVCITPVEKPERAIPLHRITAHKMHRVQYNPLETMPYTLIRRRKADVIQFFV